MQTNDAPRLEAGMPLALVLSLLVLAFLALPLLALPVQAAAAGQTGQQAREADPPSITCIVLVRPDGTLLVHEERTRFPAHDVSFKQLSGSRAPFTSGVDAVEILKVLADGRPYDPKLSPPEGMKEASRKAAGAVRLDAGPGLHDYVLEYLAHGRIRFEGDRARLAWEQTGASGAAVGCSIVLPKGAEVLEADAWTERGLGSRVKAGTRQGASPSARIFVSQGTVAKDHAFVCEMSWAKGAVAPDEGSRRLAWYTRALWAACAFELLLCLVLWFFFGRDGGTGPVAPLFRPPHDWSGGTLSPAAAGFIASGCRLSSRGFTALLASLSAKGAIAVAGSGTSGDPWIMSAPPQAPDGTGPVLAPEERIALRTLFPLQGGSMQLKDSGWTLAEARDKAYLSLKRRYGKTWELNLVPTVGMNLAALLAVACAVGIFAWRYSLDPTPFEAVGVFFVLFCPAVYYFRNGLYRTFCLWSEAGPLDMAALAGFILLMPPALVYGFMCIVFLAEEQIASNLDFLLWWGWLLVIPLCAACWWRLARTMGSWLAPMPYALKTWSVVFVVALLAKLYDSLLNDLPVASWLPLVLIFAIPSAFMLIMDRPAKAALPILNEIKGYARYIAYAETDRANAVDPRAAQRQASLQQAYPYAVALGLEKAWGAQFSGFASGASMEGGRWNAIAYDRRMRRAGQSL
ncbi:MAG: DUF2207 domain-containing protein [Desulfovibrio sp.]|nr:DUF2207 domain-containing protein [Desulfovibrio sp.]